MLDSLFKKLPCNCLKVFLNSLWKLIEFTEHFLDDPILPGNGTHYENSQDNSIQNTIPIIQSNNAIVIDNRRKAKENLENQAVKMKTWLDKKLKPAEVGATVRVPVPDVDKGRVDARNILAVVIEVKIK